MTSFFDPDITFMFNDNTLYIFNDEARVVSIVKSNGIESSYGFWPGFLGDKKLRLIYELGEYVVIENGNWKVIKK